jgi:hypothetical protein
MEHYRNQGWMVTDTRYGNPLDAVARKSAAWGVSTDGIVSTSGLGDDDLPYLEAKGTQSAGNTVLVTRGEVDHARANNGRCVMGIWAEIEAGDRKVRRRMIARGAVSSWVPILYEPPSRVVGDVYVCVVQITGSGGGD